MPQLLEKRDYANLGATELMEKALAAMKKEKEEKEKRVMDTD